VYIILLELDTSKCNAIIEGMRAKAEELAGSSHYLRTG
jgi:hypothetical protein